MRMLAKRNIAAADAGMALPSFSEETLNGKCDCNTCTGGQFNGELNLKPGSQYYMLLIGQGKGAKLEFIPSVEAKTNKGQATGSKPVNTVASTVNKDPNSADLVQRFINQKQLDQLEAGESIMLKTVKFEHRSTKLLEESAPDLDRLCKFMKMNPKVKIEIQGHVDGSSKTAISKEEEKYALTLSEGRAKTVKDHLVKNGIDTHRITYKGYGTSGMVYFGNLEDYIRYNRRVEVKILEK